MRGIHRLSVILACVTAASCADESSPAAVLVAPNSAVVGEGSEASWAAHLDLNAERAALLAADAGYAAYSSGTNLIEGTMNMVAADVVYIAPGPYITSASQVRTLLESNPANATAVLTWTAVRADVSADARRGYTYGYTEIELPDGTIVPGKYIAFWKRQPDGSWKAGAYRRNLRPAGEVSLTPPPGFETPGYAHYRYFPLTDPATELASVFATDQAFSDLAESGVSSAFTVYAAPDGAVLSGSPSIAFGAEAIAENYASLAPGALIWSPSLGDVAGTGDLAFTTGFYSFRRQNPDGTWTVVATGKYFSVWKKQLTGEWRIVIDG